MHLNIFRHLVTTCLRIFSNSISTNSKHFLRTKTVTNQLFDQPLYHAVSITPVNREFSVSLRILCITRIQFTIAKITWLMLFEEIIAVYSEKHTKHINTKCSIADCQSRWYIYLPLGLKGLVIYICNFVFIFAAVS
jgi:hypothetical protein